MGTYVVGDLQGCFEPLQRLLDECRFDPTADRLWLVGDLVNRGPHSAEVLRFVRGLGEAAVAVQGNHDLSLLMASKGLGKRHRYDTFHHVLDAPDGGELLEWLRHRPMMHVEDGYAMVHAGLLPQWTVAHAEALAREVEDALRGPRYAEFLTHMWGSHPDAWDDALAGWERLRVIVNAMTRMRFCTPGGQMEFHTKGQPDEAPAGYLPWYEIDGAAWRSHTILCGHWSALGFKRTANLLALDTGCLWGGCLTAVRLEDRAVFQVRCPQAAAPSGWQ
jgi:bis(5'-nucleosyl)-tetraphosphatase (symmetrical)